MRVPIFVSIDEVIAKFGEAQVLRMVAKQAYIDDRMRERAETRIAKRCAKCGRFVKQGRMKVHLDFLCPKRNT